MPTGDVVILKNNVKAVRSALGKEGLKRTVMAGGQVLEAEAKIRVERTFSGKSTGGAGLGGSIQTVVAKSSETAAEVDVGPTVVYARIHEFGGIIRPVHAKMLSWVSDTGERIFANMVQMPARPYLRPAFDENKNKIIDAMAFQIKKALEAATK